MKWSIYLLILANLLLLAWWYPPTGEGPGAPAPPPLPRGTEPLVLLSERATGEPAEIPAVPAAEQGSESAPGEDKPVAAAPSEPAPREPLPDLVQAPPVPEITPVPEPAPQPEPEPEPVIACLSVGPFAERSAAQDLGERLSARNIETGIRSVQAQVPAGYWVYLPAMPRVRANAIVEELSARGVKDYFVGRQNIISLGVFSDRATAERRRKQIEAYGYTPELEQRFRTTSLYWLDLEAPEPDLPTEAQWNDWLSQYPDVRREVKLCP